MLGVEGDLAVARDEEDRELRCTGGDLLIELRAVHARHDHVREEEVDTLCRREALEGLAGIAGDEAGVAQGIQELGCELAHHGVILDEEHGGVLMDCL